MRVQIGKIYTIDSQISVISVTKPEKRLNLCGSPCYSCYFQFYQVHKFYNAFSKKQFIFTDITCKTL